MSNLGFQDIHILENYQKGNFTSSYSQIWKCSKLCSFDKPVVIKEINFRNIPSIYHLYSIVYFTHSVPSYNRCVRIYLSIRRHFMYKHDFKALWLKMVLDIIPYKKYQCRQLYTATSHSVNNCQKDEKEEKTSCDNNSSISSDQRDKTKEEISDKLCSSSPIASGPGGGPSPANVFSRDKLGQYMVNPNEFRSISHFIFVEHMTASVAEEKLAIDQSLLRCQIPISKLISNNMSLSVIKSLCREHNINLMSRSPKANWILVVSGPFVMAGTSQHGRVFVK
jgi:hypothetical protein